MRWLSEEWHRQASTGDVSTFLLSVAGGGLLSLLAVASFRALWRFFVGTGSGDARCSMGKKPGELEAEKLPLPPGSLGLPVIGEMLQFIIEAPSGEFFAKRERQYGPIFKTHFVGRPTVYVAGPEAIRSVLLGEHSLVETAWPPAMRHLLGRGALSSLNGDNHRRRRRCTMDYLRRRDCSSRFASVLTQIIRDELNSWMTCSLKQPVDVYEAAKRMSTRAAARVLFGVDLPRRQDSAAAESSHGGCHDSGNGPPTVLSGYDMAQDLQDFGAGFFALPIPFPGTTFYKALMAKRRLSRALAAVLKSAEGRERDDVMTDIFLGEAMTSPTSATDDRTTAASETAINQALELLFGGQETLSGMMTCIVMLMAPQQQQQHSRENEELEDQPVYKKMTDEVLRTCGDEGEGGDAVDQLTYVDAVIKEVLRIWPPIGGGYRRAKQTFSIGGYQIPRGWAITYSIKDTHDHSPMFSADADHFNPDRWMSHASPDLTRMQPGFHYVPFGAGARACIGRQYAMLFAQTFCVELVRACRRWHLTTPLPVPMLKVPVIRPKDKLCAVFEPRVK